MNDNESRRLRATLATLQQPSSARSILEILLTAVPLAAFWVLAVLSVSRGWWWGILLVVPTAAFLVRLFMIQHDCGHQAFFRSAAANSWIGRIAGVLTMTPYEYWRRTHAIHHATSGNLDRRWLGAIELLTVEEYRALSPIRRLGYRVYRNPLVMFVVGPAYMFLLQHRLPIGLMKEPWAWRSVLGNNLGVAAVIAGVVLIGGPRALLLVHLPVIALAASIGVWLFYVQHQFEGAYWARGQDWAHDEAALLGSSHLVLPPVLRWLTANIGAHHVHHAAPRVPFYRLPEAMKAEPRLAEMNRVGLREAFGAIRLALWDEAHGRLVPFRNARAAAPA